MEIPPYLTEENENGVVIIYVNCKNTISSMCVQDEILLHNRLPSIRKCKTNTLEINIADYFILQEK